MGFFLCFLSSVVYFALLWVIFPASFPKIYRDNYEFDGEGSGEIMETDEGAETVVRK